MNKKVLFGKFIRKLRKEKELTSFIAYIFDYKNFHDYNYIFRMTEENDCVIIDIYDNVSDNRFNRYIFNFKKSRGKSKVIHKGNVFVTYINNNGSTKLYKLGYLFKLDNDKMIDYANTFLERKYVDILKKIIK